MKNHTEACDRTNDLVTYLYGEASEREAEDFARHMDRCALCRDEMAAFSHVHEGIVEWRNQSLPSFEVQSYAAPAFSEASERKRSAVAALREFFTLSPAWMRAATAVATLAVCALVVFAVMRMFKRPETVVVERIVQTGPTETELKEMVDKQVEEIRRKEKDKTDSTAPAMTTATQTAKENNPVKALKPARPRAASSTVAKQQKREMPNKVYAPQEVRQQLAEMVQSSREDDSLPMLSDLLDDSSDN